MNRENGAGNALKSCRQDGSPLGGECNTTAQPRWAAGNMHHGTDVFGFSSLPAGRRVSSDSRFLSLTFNSNMWSSTESTAESAWCRSMYYSSGDVKRNDSPKGNGYSIRCVRD